MNAEIISVGTELLMGQIVNTDEQYLSMRLSELGINLHHRQTVGDNMDRLVAAIAQGYERADILILSGGLGPTQDDITKQALAHYLGVPLVEDAGAKVQLEEWAKRYSRTFTQNNYKQTLFPKGSFILRNQCGTAPGCIYENAQKCIIVLPGPPHELKAMFEDSVFDYLLKKSNKTLQSKVLRIFGMGESSVDSLLADMMNQQDPTIAPYAALAEASLRVSTLCEHGENAQEKLTRTIDQIIAILGDCVYSLEDQSMEQVVFALLKKRNATLAVAESLTGGMICDRLVSQEGMSACLLEGAVLYTDAAKIRVGVDAAIIEQQGAVCEQVAMQMAACIRARSGATYGVSTTGVAGLGPDSRGNPEGLMFIGIATHDDCYALKTHCGGSRSRIRTYAALFALDALRRALLL